MGESCLERSKRIIAISVVLIFGIALSAYSGISLLLVHRTATPNDSFVMPTLPKPGPDDTILEPKGYSFTIAPLSEFRWSYNQTTGGGFDAIVGCFSASYLVNVYFDMNTMVSPNSTYALAGEVEDFCFRPPPSTVYQVAEIFPPANAVLTISNPTNSIVRINITSVLFVENFGIEAIPNGGDQPND